ncbi:16S rRNA (cytidine(1402)-2'-O)-methyltransferase [Ammoniphilus sp. CFH 90114]|uniref:16S rRNA (cytidine(1402)-2'-O)-methyltransferase n=1 Tax=Ammoniphilus sp. CFH 90114 TaxID=2493665 RepID=UPI00100F80E7|nr:16S rRNA (cytidine(1402)-2'-O)-methyltransferase [Ammoniphilus sp. CFH 90114]RXT08989.1 16S rRNA (cytidine(1402)-2'-O)-methyltransferase [Ammoniphilus sp. CFH 90114]
MFVQSSFAGNRGVAGELYLVATPIGNLGDITVRALEILKSVDIIAAEDTRQTRKLLNHFEIDTRLVSHHEHNKEASSKGIIQWLKEGKKLALVSDAGMPAISDPGYELVRVAIQHEIPVITIPGPNAALSALIASGLPTDKFIFLGFLPRDKKPLREELNRIKVYPETLLFYEAPHRVLKMIKEVHEVMGNRQIVLARELTKKYEEYIRGSVEEVIGYLEQQDQVRGEFTVIIEGNLGGDEEVMAEWWQELEPVAHVEGYIQQGLTSKEAIKKAAEDRKVPKRDIYNLYHGE